MKKSTLVFFSLVTSVLPINCHAALDRVNVRRMMLELKRQVISIADRLLFEQNNLPAENLVNQLESH